MAIQTIAATNVRLIRVIDLRPIDWISGERLPIPAEECNICDRCGKLHVKVYEVEADGKFYRVGSGCCKRLFGWEPAREEVQNKERKAKEEASQAALERAVQTFINQINQLQVPTPTLKRVQEGNWGLCYVYHADGLVIASDWNTEKLSDERLAMFAREWRKQKLEEALQEYEEASRTKRAKQLVQAVKKMAA